MTDLMHKRHFLNRGNKKGTRSYAGCLGLIALGELACLSTI